jgi:hypothetical protein
MCNYYLVDEVGVFSLFSGLAEMDFEFSSSNDTHPIPIGKGRYVFQGGSDLHGGIIGKVNTVYEKDLITHDFCVQGSTYDHLIPPLSSNSNSQAVTETSPSYEDISSNSEIALTRFNHISAVLADLIVIWMVWAEALI